MSSEQIMQPRSFAYRVSRPEEDSFRTGPHFSGGHGYDESTCFNLEAGSNVVRHDGFKKTSSALHRREREGTGPKRACIEEGTENDEKNELAEMLEKGANDEHLIVPGWAIDEMSTPNRDAGAGAGDDVGVSEETRPRSSDGRHGCFFHSEDNQFSDNPSSGRCPLVGRGTQAAHVDELIEITDAYEESHSRLRSSMERFASSQHVRGLVTMVNKIYASRLFQCACF